MVKSFLAAGCMLVVVAGCGGEVSPAADVGVDAMGADAALARDGAVDDATAMRDASSPDASLDAADAAADDAADDAFVASDAFVGDDAWAGDDAAVAPTDAFVSRVDASSGSRCAELAYYGSCVTRRAGVITDCRDIENTSADPVGPATQVGCAAASGTLVRTWETSRCSHATVVGGCRAVSDTPPLYCYAQVDWYYPPATSDGVRATCTGAGRTFVAP